MPSNRPTDSLSKRIKRNRRDRGAKRTRRRLGLLERLEDRRVLATFAPVDVSALIANINTANGNTEDDTIDLGGQTFTLSTIDNDPGGSNSGFAANGLPQIGGDSGNSLTIHNGTIERDTSVATPEFRILHVQAAANVTIDNVTIQGGDLSTPGPQDEDGGGILNQGDLTITNSTITGNHVSGIGGGIFLRATRRFR